MRLIPTESLGDQLGPSDAAVFQNVGVLALDLLAQPVDAAFAQHELHARLVAVLAVAVLVEHAHDGFAAVEQALFGQELVEQLGFGGQGSEAAADRHTESAAAIAQDRAQADIVDGAGDAIVAAATVERDLELARQIAGEILSQKRVADSLGVGPYVEDLVAAQARQRAGGDVAHGVVAGFAIGESGVGQQVHDVGHLGQGHEVILHVLAGGDVAFAAGEPFADARQLFHLRGGEQAAGDLAAHHLDAGLTLPVDAVLEAERAEVVLRDFAGEEGVGFAAEGFDFFADQVVVLELEVVADAEGIFDESGHRESPYSL